MLEEDWELCKELARFLAALDETGDTLREAMEMVNIPTRGRPDRGVVVGNGLMARLEVPSSGVFRPIGDASRRIGGSDSELEGQSASDAGSIISGTRSENRDDYS